MRPGYGGSGQDFGTSVAAAAEFVAIGHPTAEIGGVAVGRVNIYREAASGLDHVQTLFSTGLPSSASGSGFGRQVAFSGSDLLVCEPFQAGNAGAVHVYRLQGGQWVHVQEIGAPVTGLTSFGTAIAASTDTLVISGVTATGFWQLIGTCHVYRRQSGMWILDAALSPSSLSPGGVFSALSIDGDVLALSTVEDHVPDSGNLWIFERSGGAWVEVFHDEGPGAFTHWGRGVAVTGQDVVIGEGGNASFGNRGRAHVYRRTGAPGGPGAWTMVQTIASPLSNSDGDEIGFSVAARGDHLLIGAPAYDYGAPGFFQSAYGAALLFRRDAQGVWQPSTHLSKTCPLDWMNRAWGRIVVLTERWMIAASIHPSPAPGDSGLVGFYPYPVPSSVLCAGPVNTSGAPANLEAGGDSLAVANRFFVGATQLPDDSFAMLLASQTPANLAVPGANGALCLSPASLARIGFHGGTCDHWSQRLDTSSVPTSPPSSIQAGATWHFQVWHRDQASPTQTSAFTEAISVTFN